MIISGNYVIAVTFYYVSNIILEFLNRQVH